MTTTFDPTELVRFPEPNPWGTGEPFEIIVRSDILTFHGNVVAKAGRYEACQSIDAPEGVVTIWSPGHHTGGMWCSLSAHDWTFPGEASRPIPDHDCYDPDHLRSGVAGGIFCGICRKEVFV